MMKMLKLSMSTAVYPMKQGRIHEYHWDTFLTDTAVDLIPNAIEFTKVGLIDRLTPAAKPISMPDSVFDEFKDEVELKMDEYIAEWEEVAAKDELPPEYTGTASPSIKFIDVEVT